MFFIFVPNFFDQRYRFIDEKYFNLNGKFDNFQRIAVLNKNGHLYTIGDTNLDFEGFINFCGKQKVNGILNE
jgi:hypothetical protein